MKIRTIVFLVFALATIFPNITNAAEKPLRANIFLSWHITDVEAAQLSKWDLLILDAEIGALQPKLIKKIRARNPRIKILAYISGIELQKDQPKLSKHAPLRAALRARTPESAYARRADGSPISFWPTAQVMNATGEWQTILPKFIQEKILATKLWDGIMLDNVWDGVSWYVGATDLDNNRIEDSPQIANIVWNSSMRTIIAQIKKQSPRALVIANGSEIYSELDGIVFENFGQKNTPETIKRIHDFSQNNKRMIVINSTAENLAEPSHQQMLFGLANSLLVDAYFSYDIGDTNHASLWWFKEYDFKLGNARGPAIEQQPQVWSRTFKNGIVYVNTSSATTTISNITLTPKSSKIILTK